VLEGKDQEIQKIHSPEGPEPEPEAAELIPVKELVKPLMLIEFLAVT
jgi:hypothetical protein